MKLRTRISAVFAIALTVFVIIVIAGLTFVLDSLSTRMLEKQAENITLFLQHRIIAGTGAAPAGETRTSVISDFRIAQHIADESRGFKVKKILLIRPDFMVETALPESEAGKRCDDEDIRDAFRSRTMKTVVEAEKESGSKDIDVVAYFTAADGSPMVLEVKLDFAESIALLEAQYAGIETGAIVIAVLLLSALLGILLFTIGRTAVKPLQRVTLAMDRVGRGSMDIILEESGTDEFRTLARRFNEMVKGLKEKLGLYKYVSKGTIAAVQESISGNSPHRTERKDLTLFFSDIRGFTRFSEPRDPETVTSALNRILSLQADVIRSHGGDIDKFVGDEVMAVFELSAPAVEAAVEIQRKMDENREIYDGLHIGIGIHRGPVMQGDVGSDDMKDYTVIGDNVNTAARLESVAKADEVLISQSVADDESVRRRFTLTEKGELALKGKETKIPTYAVAGISE